MLRLARKSDLMDIFYLENDETVRFYSFNQNQISLENHKKWFEKILANKKAKIYVYKSSNDDLIGICHFEGYEESKISISISSKFRKQGRAKKFIKWVLAKNKNKHFLAFIKKENLASIKLFESCGFKFSCSCDDLKVLKYEIYT